MAGQRLSPGFEVHGFDQVQRNLNAVLRKMPELGAAGLEVVAIKVGNEAAEFSPVLSGRLKASWTGDNVPDSHAGDEVGPHGVMPVPSPIGPMVEVGSHVVYAPAIEFGGLIQVRSYTRKDGTAVQAHTRRVTPTPMLRPAMHRAEAYLAGDVALVIRHGLPAAALASGGAR